MMRRLMAASAFAALAITAPAAQAQDNWVTIGSKSVPTNGRTSDTIDISGARGNFKAIRLITKDGGIVIENVEVVYSGGSAHNERRPINMNPNDRTRAIDQRDQARFIDRVTLSFKSGAGNPIVEIQGLQNSEGARALRTGSAAAPVTPQPGGFYGGWITSELVGPFKGERGSEGW